MELDNTGTEERILFIYSTRDMACHTSQPCVITWKHFDLQMPYTEACVASLSEDNLERLSVVLSSRRDLEHGKQIQSSIQARTYYTYYAVKFITDKVLLLFKQVFSPFSV